MVGLQAKLPSDDRHSRSVRYPPLNAILQCDSVFQLLMHLGARAVVTYGISEEDQPLEFRHAYTENICPYVGSSATFLKRNVDCQVASRNPRIFIVCLQPD